MAPALTALGSKRGEFVIAPVPVFSPFFGGGLVVIAAYVFQLGPVRYCLASVNDRCTHRTHHAAALAGASSAVNCILTRTSIRSQAS